MSDPLIRDCENYVIIEPGQEEKIIEQEGGSPLEDLPREIPEGIGYKILHQGYLLWWAVTTIGLIFAILLLVWSGQDADYNLEL